MSESEHDPDAPPPLDEAATAAIGDVLVAAALVVAVQANPEGRLTPEQREIVWPQVLAHLAGAIASLDVTLPGDGLRAAACSTRSSTRSRRGRTWSRVRTRRRR